MRIAVGMSGGVDSSVAALLLVRAGHAVTGVTMLVYSGPRPPAGPGAVGRAASASAAHTPAGAERVCGGDSCFSPDEDRDAEEAARVCAFLGIPHRTVDLRAEYRALVLDHARAEYLAGRTPNPCVRCNQLVKFGLLFDRVGGPAAGLGTSSTGVLATACVDPGFDAFATGHYCRISHDPVIGATLLRMAKDASKDQSYFLCMLSPEQIARTLFPLGELTKAEVRELARQADLPNHARPDSQDFAAGGYRDALALPDLEGPIVNADGSRVGSHKGVWGYTIGQRRGLGPGAGAAARPRGGAARYVTRIDAATNTLFIGPAEELLGRMISVGSVGWACGRAPERPLRLAVKVRARHTPAQATVTPLGGGRAEVLFDEPQRAIAPGQWAAFYDGECLFGAGVIE